MANLGCKCISEVPIYEDYDSCGVSTQKELGELTVVVLFLIFCDDISTSCVKINL